MHAYVIMECKTSVLATTARHYKTGLREHGKVKKEKKNTHQPTGYKNRKS